MEFFVKNFVDFVFFVGVGEVRDRIHLLVGRAIDHCAANGAEFQDS